MKIKKHYAILTTARSPWMTDCGTTFFTSFNPGFGAAHARHRHPHPQSKKIKKTMEHKKQLSSFFIYLFIHLLLFSDEKFVLDKSMNDEEDGEEKEKRTKMWNINFRCFASHRSFTASDESNECEFIFEFTDGKNFSHRITWNILRLQTAISA